MENTAEVSRKQAEPHFTLQWAGEPADGFSAASMLDANRDDAEVCEFVRGASIGDELRTGGGAAPACTLRRVS